MGKEANKWEEEKEDWEMKDKKCIVWILWLTVFALVGTAVLKARAATYGHYLKTCTPWLDKTGWGTGANSYAPAVGPVNQTAMSCIDDHGTLWVTSAHVASDPPVFRPHGLLLGGAVSSCFPWSDLGTWAGGGHIYYPNFTGSANANPMGCLTPDGTLLIMAYPDVPSNGANFYPYGKSF